MTEEKRKIYRSRKDRMLAGVSGGLGDYFGIDSTIIRLAFVAFALLGGPGFLVYIICMIVIPIEPDSSVAVIEHEAN
jgi:phage shock protein C